MRVLYVLGDVPARGSGGFARVAGTTAAMAQSAAVEVLYPRRARGAGPPPALEHLAGTEVRAVAPGSLVQRAAAAGTQLGRLRPFAVARSYNPALSEAVRAALATGHYDVVVADRLTAAAACLDAGAGGRLPSRYNSHNVESELRPASGPRERLAWSGVRRLERRVLEAFDETWVVSERDRSAMQAIGPGAATRLVRNAVNLADVPFTEPALEPVVLFVGSFDYRPNRQALSFLVSEVMPLVWSSHPEARVEAVGRWEGAPWEPRDRRVRIAGFVDDLGEAYRGARCCVAPLLVSGGTPFKVPEGLASGLPVVASSTAVEALPELRKLVRTGSTPAELASELSAVLDPGYDHGSRGVEGRALVERLYSFEAVAAALAGSLRDARTASSTKSSVAEK